MLHVIKSDAGLKKLQDAVDERLCLVSPSACVSSARMAFVSFISISQLQDAQSLQSSTVDQSAKTSNHMKPGILTFISREARHNILMRLDWSMIVVICHGDIPWKVCKVAANRVERN